MDEFYFDVVKDLFEEGKSQEQVMSILGISREEWASWMENKDFARIVGVGLMQSEAFYEDQIQRHLFISSKLVNTRLIEVYMRQRFGWLEENKTPLTPPIFQVIMRGDVEDVAKHPDPYSPSGTV